MRGFGESASKANPGARGEDTRVRVRFKRLAMHQLKHPGLVQSDEAFQSERRRFWNEFQGQQGLLAN